MDIKESNLIDGFLSREQTISGKLGFDGYSDRWVYIKRWLIKNIENKRAGSSNRTFTFRNSIPIGVKWDQYEEVIYFQTESPILSLSADIVVRKLKSKCKIFAFTWDYSIVDNKDIFFLPYSLNLMKDESKEPIDLKDQAIVSIFRPGSCKRPLSYLRRVQSVRKACKVINLPIKVYGREWTTFDLCFWKFMTFGLNIEFNGCIKIEKIELISRSVGYLAFENACKDSYISEKFLDGVIANAFVYYIGGDLNKLFKYAGVNVECNNIEGIQTLTAGVSVEKFLNTPFDNRYLETYLQKCADLRAK